MGKRNRIQEVTNSKSKKMREEEDDVNNQSDSDDQESDQDAQLPPGTRLSDEPPIKKGKWINKKRVLIFAARGITHRDRHLMNNLKEMMPHSKGESKVEAKDYSSEIDEIALMKNCNRVIFFDNKKRKDTYLWMSVVGRGPSVKFLVESIQTSEELKMTGNCLKGSRPLLSFDPKFDNSPHLKLLRELMTQTFGTPNHHPKSQPFFDHVVTFTVLDHRIWFRNYQIVEEDGSLAEIGPRFVLNPIKIFDGSFGGPVLWANEHYVSPNDRRRALKMQAQDKYKERLLAKHAKEARQPRGQEYADIDPHAEVFDTIRPEEAASVMKPVFARRK